MACTARCVHNVATSLLWYRAAVLLSWNIVCPHVMRAVDAVLHFVTEWLTLLIFRLMGMVLQG